MIVKIARKRTGWRSLQVTLIILLFFPPVSGQENLSINGYLNDMQSLYHVEPLGWLWQNQVHNRLNVEYYPADWLHISVQARTRFITGDSLLLPAGYTDQAKIDRGWMDLSWAYGHSLGNESNMVLSSMLDRLLAEFTFGDFVATIGRQRINWGQTFAWNPNDIFNTYSYFDVDYPERPGSDAIRLQYYTGIASNIEVAAKVDHNKKLPRQHTTGLTAADMISRYLQGFFLNPTWWQEPVGVEVF